MMSRIVFDPLIPLSLWFPLLLAAAALMVFYGWSSRNRLTGRRRSGILVLMATALLLPLALLLNPTWTEPIPPPPGKPQLTILVDQSAGMDTRDPATGRSRYEEAAHLAATAARHFEAKYDLRVFGFDTELHATTAAELAMQKPEGAATDLAAALEQSLDAERAQGQFVLLLSDGVHNSGPATRLREVLAKARATATPVFTRTLTGAGEVDDLELELGLSQEIAFAAQQVPVTVRLRQRGRAVDTARLALKLDGETLEERTVDIGGDATAESAWTVSQPKSGLYRYEISVDPLPGETTVVNNTAALLLRVVEEPVRVLLLEGKPYWDTKYLVRTLSADPSIELTSVVQVAEGRLHCRRILPVTENDGEADPQRPASVKAEQWTVETEPGRFLAESEELDQYQIVVLGRDAEVFLSSASDSGALVRLKRWLSEGTGSLVCFRGSPTSQINERLGQLLPLRWEPSQESRFRLQMTPAGQALRWLPGSRDSDDPLPAMPSLATVSRPGTPKPLAVVLASAETEGGQTAPVITYQPVGNGRVVVVEGAGMWRWAFLPPTYQDRDEIYAALWRSLVRWLVSNVGLLPSQDLALRTDTTSFSTEESAGAMLLLREDRVDKLPEVELSGDALAPPRPVTPVPAGEPGQYRLVFGRLPEGHYRVNVVGEKQDDVAGRVEFDVRGNLRERLDITPQPETMQMIAQDSGGAVIADDDWNVLAGHFNEHLTRTHPARSTQTPLWDRWWVLAGIVLLWGCSWGLRRSSGLV